MSATKTPEPTAKTRALMSRERADHPGATPGPTGVRCAIKRTHEPHPYGAIHPDGGLAHWCVGRLV